MHILFSGQTPKWTNGERSLQCTDNALRYSRYIYTLHQFTYMYTYVFQTNLDNI